MILSKKQIKKFQNASIPLIEFLKTLHPHVQCIVSSERSEILEGLASVPKEKSEREQVSEDNKFSKNTDKPFCCFIPCHKDAEWQIIYGNTSDDYTESCNDHIGELLTDAKEHTVIPIEMVM